MQVREVMSHPVVTIGAGETLERAAQVMRVHHVGALPVRAGKDLVGIITDRDIVTRGIALGSNPNTTAVRSIMTAVVASCEEEDPVWEAAQEMQDTGVHRLVVLDEEGDPVGLVSADDLARVPRDELVEPDEDEPEEPVEDLEEFDDSDPDEPD